MHACMKGEIFKTRTLGVKTTSVTYCQPPWNDPLWRKITKLKDTECILLQDTTVNIIGCNSDTPTVLLCPRPLFQSCTYHLDSSSVTQCHHQMSSTAAELSLCDSMTAFSRHFLNVWENSKETSGKCPPSLQFWPWFQIWGKPKCS